MILYAHRLRTTSGSGVQRYTDGLLAGLAEVVTPDWQLAAVSPDRVPPERRGGRIAFRSVRLPRKVIHGLWTMAGQPPLEAVAGGTDLVHLLSTAIPVPSRAPQVITVHDLFTLRHPEWFEPRSVSATVKALRRATASARRIIAPSSFVADDIAETLDVDPGRIAVVPEGVSESFLAPRGAAEEVQLPDKYGLRPQSYLITVGLLSPRKNLKVLGEAWSLLRARLGDRTPILLVVGPDDVGHESVRADIDQLRLAGHVRLTGHVPDPDLRALLANAVALLHPSLDEGFGLPPLEAMAAGVPALVSNSGAIPEVTGNAARHLEPRDPAAWADAVEAIVARPDERAQLIEEGRRRAAMFSWSASAKRTLDVYREALAEG